MRLGSSPFPDRTNAACNLDQAALRRAGDSPSSTSGAVERVFGESRRLGGTERRCEGTPSTSRLTSFSETRFPGRV